MKALTDEHLAARAQTGDRHAVDELMRRYERAVTGEASQFFLAGADHDDTCQEARIGLLRAIEQFDAAREVPFGRYAHLSMRRQLITAVKAANRMKHRPLNDSAREGVNEDGDAITVVDLVEAFGTDAQTLLEQRSELRRIGRTLRVVLTPDEAASLILFANGASYAQIVARTGFADEKAVDNGLVRARMKIEVATVDTPPPFRGAQGARSRPRRVYACPSCGHETVRAQQLQGKPGRPPACNVCATRKAA